jgi:hypothetical protein
MSESVVSSPSLRATVYTKDSIVNRVIEKFVERSAVGVEKYGTTLDRSDLSVVAWATHMQEELMDGILYLEKWRLEVEAADAFKKNP